MGIIVGKLKAKYFGYEYKHAKRDRIFKWFQMFTIMVGILFFIWFGIMVAISKLNEFITN